MNSLPDTQKNLKAALPARGAAFVLRSLLELLPESSPKYNLLITLQAEFRTWQTAALSGILSEEVKSLKANQLNSRILEFIDGLSPEDFDKNTRRSRITENARIRKGNVLYQIPREMKLEAECRCLVRIAFDKEMLLEALDMTVHTEMREQIRISDYMKVEIVDPSSTPVFRIVARSEPIQLIDEDEYTEWRFLITPLKTGRHVLELKVSIMEHINGEDRVREKTLEESVVIITDPTVDAEPPVWKTDPEALLMPCKVQSIAPQRFNWSGGGWRTMALALALLVGVSSVAYAYGPIGLREGVDWAIARYLQDSESAYNAFLEAYPNSTRKETAVFRRAKAIQQTNAERTEEAMLAYLEEYGNTAQYADEAWWAVATTTQAPEDYQQYANLQGEQPREAEAKAAIAQLENSLWRDIKAQTTAVQLDRYLRLYPQGSYRSQAISLLADTAHWVPDPRLPERLLRDTANWRTRIKAYAQETDGPTAQQLQRLAAKPAGQITKISAAGNRTDEQKTEATEDARQEAAPPTSPPQQQGGNTATTSTTSPKDPPPPTPAEILPQAATIADIAANMVRIPGGTFTMGCQDGRDTDCFDQEKPAHKVTLSTYYISKYEVTQAQWRAVMGSDPPELYNQGCDICPVEGVSWDDIQDFLRKLNAQTGQNYRLPTEAEWEYAARGGGGSRGYMYSGSNDLNEVGWFDDNYKSGNTWGERPTTRPVGGKKANELGLYDMSGNVWEWCEDDWHDNYMGAPTDGRAWVNSGRGTYRVNRGGGWVNAPQSCRAAFRYNYAPTYRNLKIGFRLAR